MLSRPGRSPATQLQTPMTNRPAIPEPIKRQVRQECFFGCVLCGAPVFHYDHIEEYSVVNEHTAGNIALLCEMHHGAKTTGKLSADRVASGRLAPFNGARTQSAPYKIEPNGAIDILIGTNRFSSTVFNGNNGTTHGCIWVNGASFLILHQEMGWLSISAAFTNEEGEVVLRIEQGEVSVSTGVWDYRYEGTRLQARQAQGSYLLDMDLSNTTFHLHSGQFLFGKGDGFLINDGRILVMASGRVLSQLSNCAYHSNGGGDLGLLTQSAPIGVAVPNGFGMFFST
jgi:hypothetical protein